MIVGQWSDSLMRPILTRDVQVGMEGASVKSPVFEWPLPCLKPLVNCWFPSRFGFPTSDESANIPIIKQHNQSLLFFGSHSNKTTTHDQRHHLKLLAFQCELKLRPELVSWVSLRWNKTWKSQRVWDQKWSNSPHKACSLRT